MPIVNLTTTKPTPSAALPMLGRIYKGAPQKPHPNPQKAKDGIKIAGNDLKHFRIEFEDQFAHLAPEWERMYGPEPTELRGVYLLGRDADEAFPAWYESWSKTAMLSRCTGETQVRYFENGTYHNEPRPCRCDAKKRTCKQVGRLPVMVRPFSEATGYLGYFLLVTHSIHDIAEIYQTLAATLEMQKTLLSIPFVLGRQLKPISMPKDDGSRVTVEKAMIYLYTDPSFTARAIATIEAGYQLPQLPATTVVAAASGVDLAAGANAFEDSAALLTSDGLSEPDVIEADEYIEQVTPKPVRVDCSIKSVSVLEMLVEKTPRNQSGKQKYLKLVTDQAVEVRLLSRALFIDAGWISDQEWTNLGKRELTPWIPAVIETTDGKEWKLIEVKQKPEVKPSDAIPFE